MATDGRLFALGVPLPVGGANTEFLHTLLLFHKMGLEVTCVYFAKCGCGQKPAQPEPCNPMVAQLRALGIVFVAGEPGRFAEIPGLPGAILYDCCNPHAVHCWPELAKFGCKLIHSPAMCWSSLPERRAFEQAPPSAVHFQSDFQRSRIADNYRGWGVPDSRQFVIRGAFDVENWPFAYRPRPANAPFVVGRLARPYHAKWHPEMFEVLRVVRQRGIDVRFRGMGWNAEVQRVCGQPPEWAQVFAPDTMSSREFLGGCDALLCMNSKEAENDPRVGMEAMATGVPVVAERRWGWPAQIKDGRTGLLYSTPGEAWQHLERLARDEGFRSEITRNARESVMQQRDPNILGAAWKLLLDAIA